MNLYRDTVRAALPAAVAQANRYLDAITKGNEVPVHPMINQQVRATVLAEFLSYAAEREVKLDLHDHGTELTL